MALAGQSINPLKPLDFPDWATAQLMKEVPGVWGSVMNCRINGFIHLMGTPKEDFVPHSWSSSVSFSDEATRRELQKVVDDLPKRMKEIPNYYSEWDYDDEGKQVEGSEHKIYFDKWLLIDRGGRKVLFGEAAQ